VGRLRRMAVLPAVLLSRKTPLIIYARAPDAHMHTRAYPQT